MNDVHPRQRVDIAFNEAKQKFLVELFTKSSQITKTASFFALRRVRNSRVELVQLLSSGAFLKDQKELCSVAIGNFAQSFMGKKQTPD